MEIKVFGAGCSSCSQLYDNVYQAIEQLQLDVEPEFVHDISKGLEYGILQIPALVVNGKAISYGRTLSVDEVKKILEENKD